VENRKGQNKVSLFSHGFGGCYSLQTHLLTVILPTTVLMNVRAPVKNSTFCYLQYVFGFYVFLRILLSSPTEMETEVVYLIELINLS